MDDFLKSIERLEALAKKLEDPNSGLGIPIVNPADLEEYAYRPGENIGEYFRRLGFDDSSLGDLKQTEFYQEYEEIPDFEDCVKEYEPQKKDKEDREFIDVLKKWFTNAISKIEEKDVYIMQLVYQIAAEKELKGDLFIAYNTESYCEENGVDVENRWNFLNWKDDYFKSMDDALLQKWYKARGFDNESDQEVIESIFDLAVIAVSELNEEKVIEKQFGKRILVLIGEMDTDHMIVVRAAKACGEDLIEKDLLDYYYF